MTVDELILALQVLSERGYGNEKVVSGDYLHLELGYEDISSVDVRDFTDGNNDFDRFVYIS